MAPAGPSSGTSAQELPGAFQLINVPLSTALDVYRSLAGVEMVLAPEVEQSQATITATARRPLTKAKALELLERALREQAGVTMTRLDDGRLSVNVPGG